PVRGVGLIPDRSEQARSFGGGASRGGAVPPTGFGGERLTRVAARQEAAPHAAVPGPSSPSRSVRPEPPEAGGGRSGRWCRTYSRGRGRGRTRARRRSP